MIFCQILGTQQIMAKGLKLNLVFLNSLRMCRPKDPASAVVKPLPVSAFLLSPLHSKSYELPFPSFPKPPPCTPTDICSPRGVVAPYKVHPLGREDGSGSYSMRPRMTSGLNNELASEKYSDRRNSFDSNERASWPVQPLRTENTKLKSKTEKSRASASTSSSGDNDETESLFSSPPRFSSPHDHKHKKPLSSHRTATTRRFKRFGSKDWIDGVIITPERNCQVEKPVLGRLVPCKEDGKTNNESCVVVKQSIDPYKDFKKSILEMIMDKQMFEPKELEQLLTNFLSLNARMHHQVIIEAFTEILKEVFSGNRTSI